MRRIGAHSVLGLLAVLVLGASDGAAVGVPHAGPPPLVRDVRAAARRYAVPPSLLLAIGWTNSHWRMWPRPSADGGWGVMDLVENGSRHGLVEAARLAAVPVSAARADERQNIRAGAALLARLEGPRRPRSVAGWYRAVAVFGGSRAYADEVYATLERGASASVRGTEIRLPAARDLRARPALAATPGMAPDYPNGLWTPASRSNYQPADRPRSSPITRIVIHVTDGSYAGTIAWFQNPKAHVSAHYVIRSLDGQVTQLVRDKDIAWHSGNPRYNATAIGIEHEGYTTDCSWFTAAMYRSSAQLVAYLARKYGIPIDRQHIIGHNEVPDPNHPGQFGGASHHTDPGHCWDWPLYMTLVQQAAHAAPSGYEQIVSTDTATRFAAPPAWRRLRSASRQLSSTYAVAAPGATADPASFKLVLPLAGRYALSTWWPANTAQNGAVPVSVDTSSGSHALTLDERTSGGRWVYLGTFALDAGASFVRFSRQTSATGLIAADAVKVEQVVPLAEAKLTSVASGFALTPSALSRTANTGASWVVTTPPGVAAAASRGFEAEDPAHAAFVTLDDQAPASLSLFRTSDGGTSWQKSRLPTPQNVAASHPVGVSFVDALHGFVSVSTEAALWPAAQGALLRTADGGASWQQLALPTDGTIRFADRLNGWLLSSDRSGLFATQDGGATWRRIAVTAPRRYARSVASYSLPVPTGALNAVLAITYSSTPGGAVAFAVSHNGGRSWKAATTVASRRRVPFGTSIPTAVIDVNHWLAAMEGGARLVAVTRGQAPGDVRPAGLRVGGANAHVDALSFASVTTGWATVVTGGCGTQSGCRIKTSAFGTHDGGRTWTAIAPP